MYTDTKLEEALTVLGDVLADRHEAHDLVLIGGGAMLLTGLIHRPTADLDVLARAVGEVWISARPFPTALSSAVRDVAETLDLAPNWLNAGPAGLMEHALPEGFMDRTEARIYGSLTVRFAARRDLVAFKLDAAADHWPDRSKHFRDLQRLSPTSAELIGAREWCRTHRDPDRLSELDEVITALVMGDTDG